MLPIITNKNCLPLMLPIIANNGKVKTTFVRNRVATLVGHSDTRRANPAIHKSLAIDKCPGSR